MDQSHPEIREPAPEADRQEGHEEGMRAEVGGQGEVGVEERCAGEGLETGEVGCFPAHQGDEALPEVVPPLWQFLLVVV